MNSYNAKVKRVVKFRGGRDVGAADAFLMEVQRMMTLFAQLIEAGTLTVEELILDCLDGDARAWFMLHPYTDWATFKQDFLRRFAETRDEVLARYKALRFTEGDNPYAHAHQFEVLARAVGYSSDSQRMLDDFLSSVADPSLRAEVRIRGPENVAAATKILHTVTTARADVTPAPIASKSPSTQAPAPSGAQAPSWESTMQQLAADMQQMKINMGRLQQRLEDKPPPNPRWQNNYMHHNSNNNNNYNRAPMGRREDTPTPSRPGQSHPKSSGPEPGRAQLVSVDSPAGDLAPTVAYNRHLVREEPFGTPLVAPGRVRRVPVDEDAPAPRLEGAPPAGPHRAGVPLQVGDADPDMTVTQLVARRAIHQRVSMTIPELYAVGGDKFRSDLQKEFNTMHARTAQEAPRQLAIQHTELGERQPLRTVAETKVNQAMHASVTPHPLLKLAARVNDLPCQITIDTGAQVNVITPPAVHMLGLDIDTTTPVNFRGVDGVAQTSVGLAACNLRIGPRDGVVVHQTFLVVDDNDPKDYTILCGLPFITAVGMSIHMDTRTVTVRKDKTTHLTLDLLSLPDDMQSKAKNLVSMVRPEPTPPLPTRIIQALVPPAPRSEHAPPPPVPPGPPLYYPLWAPIVYNTDHHSRLPDIDPPPHPLAERHMQRPVEWFVPGHVSKHGPMPGVYVGPQETYIQAVHRQRQNDFIAAQEFRLPHDEPKPLPGPPPSGAQWAKPSKMHPGMWYVPAFEPYMPGAHHLWPYETWGQAVNRTHEARQRVGLWGMSALQSLTKTSEEISPPSSPRRGVSPSPTPPPPIPTPSPPPYQSPSPPPSWWDPAHPTYEPSLNLQRSPSPPRLPEGPMPVPWAVPSFSAPGMWWVEARGSEFPRSLLVEPYEDYHDALARTWGTEEEYESECGTDYTSRSPSPDFLATTPMYEPEPTPEPTREPTPLPTSEPTHSPEDGNAPEPAAPTCDKDMHTFIASAAVKMAAQLAEAYPSSTCVTAAETEPNAGVSCLQTASNSVQQSAQHNPPANECCDVLGPTSDTPCALARPAPQDQQETSIETSFDELLSSMIDELNLVSEGSSEPACTDNSKATTRLTQHAAARMQQTTCEDTSGGVESCMQEEVPCNPVCVPDGASIITHGTQACVRLSCVPQAFRDDTFESTTVAPIPPGWTPDMTKLYSVGMRDAMGTDGAGPSSAIACPAHMHRPQPCDLTQAYDKLPVWGVPHEHCVQVGKQAPQWARDQLSLILAQYHDVFAFSMSDLKEPAKVRPHTIHLMPNTPSLMVPARRVPKIMEQIEAQLIRDQLEAGLIEPCTQSSFRSNLLFLHKRTSPGVAVQDLPPEDRFRAVVDYRGLNNYTMNDSQPMAVLPEVLEAVAQGHLFSILDVKGAFYQVPLDEQSRPYTAFATAQGLFQYKRMPMGLKGSPATWARAINDVVAGLDGVKPYVDDICVYTTPAPATTPGSAADREKNLYLGQLDTVRATMARFRERNVKLSPSKCIFLADCVRFTGFILQGGTITTDPEKVRAVDGLKPWLSFKDLEKYLGFVVYYGASQIYNLSARTKLLRDLRNRLAADGFSKSRLRIPWSDECEAVRLALNEEIKVGIIKYAPDWSVPFTISTDFCKDGIAAVLSQEVNGKEQIVAMASRATRGAEKTLSSAEGELRAVQYGVETYHYYVYGRPFKLVTDSMALLALEKHKGQNTRLGRLALRLTTEYQFEVKHRPGKKHGNVDILSRNPVEPGIQEVINLDDGYMDTTPRPPTHVHSPSSFAGGEGAAADAAPKDNEDAADGGPKINLLRFSQSAPSATVVTRPLQPPTLPTPRCDPAPATPSRPTPPPPPPALPQPVAATGGNNTADSGTGDNALLTAMMVAMQAANLTAEFWLSTTQVISAELQKAQERDTLAARAPPATHATTPAAAQPTHATAASPVAGASAPAAPVAYQTVLVRQGPASTPASQQAAWHATGGIPVQQFQAPVVRCGHRKLQRKSPAATQRRPAAQQHTTIDADVGMWLSRLMDARDHVVTVPRVNMTRLFGDAPTHEESQEQAKRHLEWRLRELNETATENMAGPSRARQDTSPEARRGNQSNVQGPFGVVSPVDHAPAARRGTPQRSSPTVSTEGLPTTPATALPVPVYEPVGVDSNMQDGSPIDMTAKCSVCAKDDDPANLLVCEGCKKVVHTYCKDDVLPEGYVPSGPYYCVECSPFDLQDRSWEQPTDRTDGKYADQYADAELLATVRDEAPAASDRVRRRAKHYSWDHVRGCMMTTEKHPRMIPPPNRREQLIIAAHHSLGHRAYRSVSDALRIHYTWRNMRQQVREVIARCSQCETAQLHRTLRRPDGQLQSIPQAQLFTRWVVDLLTMPYTVYGARYIAVAVESYSRYVVAGALHNKWSKTVCSWFKNDVICKYGAPMEVQCDRGGEFMGDFAKMCTAYCIKLTRGAPYHPQSQGLVERANRTLLAGILKALGDDAMHWHEHLPAAVFGMNACKQASTRYSPHYLLFGVHPRIPSSVPTPEKDWAELGEEEAATTGLAKRIKDLQEAHENAVSNMQKAQARQAVAYAARKGITTDAHPVPLARRRGSPSQDASAAVPPPTPAAGAKRRSKPRKEAEAQPMEPLKEGTRVWKKKLRAQKGQPKVEGPYTVVKCMDNTVLVEGGNGHRWEEPRSSLWVAGPGEETPTKRTKPDEGAAEED